ncbi:MAG: bifunctional 5,10-methylenetetrahydrofolate dehydrogenase/5,10-methenyltetrahydrofolate cyclohydrolase [Anaerolineae bacterium]
MTAQIIDGREVASRIQDDIREEVKVFEVRHGFVPGLAVLLVGDDPASAMYVRMKARRCDSVGMNSFTKIMPADSTQQEVLDAVQAFNDDPNVHGILVQLPLPDHIDEETILKQVSLAKDVDGFHPVNIGALAMKGRTPTFTPATPTGCMTLIAESGVDVAGKTAVVLGRSNIVGMPMALMLNNANATVTIVHSRTPNIAEVISRADILIAAIGQPEYVQAEWLKPGAIVIDVGTNKIDAPDTDRGYKWVGDVEFEGAQAVAGAITIVPGGVGPLTIASLIQNTLKAAKMWVSELA